MRHRQRVLREARRLAFAGAFALVATLSDASALFIVNQPWVSPTRKGQNTSAYMTLTSTEGATILHASSEDARSVSIRSPRSALHELPLPPKSKVALAPAHAHLRLTGIGRTLKVGDRVTIVLTVRDAEGAVSEIPVNAEVRLRSPVDDERRAHPH